ncbi:threonine synthase [Lutispora saccharofermentans]|uniref:Threonine synthase n=1 Tax=Lutispora saccharofermentans TaxID=3024236 RepID=A0ABT1NC81_9FIRM|nr:threonine synthase [Lutispora saccharofermentans]MCQ1528639.1 threonine synthase [Lutispora saccharofermentans]
MYKGLIERYKDYLKDIYCEDIITLNEGNTPFIHSRNLSDAVGNCDLYFKYEGVNPTGSFKDRGMTAAITKAVSKGSKTVICASTGNTSASAAAYAARAGIKCIVLIPEGKVAMGKLAQAIVYGADIIQVKGNFDQALTLVKEAAERFPVTIVNSINPYRLEGQKTGAFEICDDLRKAPDYQFMPVGNAGNISAYWKGYKEYRENNVIGHLPRMMGVQAAGAAPIVEGRVIENPETIATAIRIGNPASWDKANAALIESQGAIDKVTDEEILEAYRLLSAREGIFAEPASCASLAGLMKYVKTHDLSGKTVVCILTGNGLKDPDTAMNREIDIKKISANIDDLMKILS